MRRKSVLTLCSRPNHHYDATTAGKYEKHRIKGALLFLVKRGKLPIKKAVRQAETTSPILFTACLEEVFKLLEWGGLRMNINGEYPNNRLFADDIVLISNIGN